ncbi:MAG: acyltransferase [Anaerolineae bacterium]|nr:acyltransferase [Gloeobacterales cyanobacterium ES-bin-313]
MKRIFGLDLLRASAISLVLIDHAAPLYEPRPQFLDVFGFLGVEMFFVLSGFLIGGILIAQFEERFTPNDIWNFWIRRWFRTIPNYLLFLGIAMFISYKHGNLFNGVNDIWKYFLFLQNFSWKQSDFFTISWTLAVEEWFYLLLPLLLFLRSRLTKESKQATLLMTILSVVVAVTAVRCAYVYWLDPAWDNEVRRIVVLRLDALIYGVFGAYLVRYHEQFWHRERYTSFIVGTGLLVSCIYAYFELSLDHSYFGRTLLFSAVSLAIFCFLPLLNTWSSSSKSPIAETVTCVSLWSYSLYLSHREILGLVMSIRERFLHNSGVNTLLFSMLYIALSLILSWLCFNYFEKPTTRLREQFRLRKVQVEKPVA